VRIPRRRVEAWLDALKRAQVTVERLAQRLNRVTAILYGSYARGDFNIWSDIDLIVVSEAFEDIRPLDRYDMVLDLLEANVEPVLLTPREFVSALSRPAWRQALASGSVIIRDDYGLKDLLKERTRASPLEHQELVRKVAKFLKEAVEI
jgi:predicted nucleotidyltransferase